MSIMLMFPFIFLLYLPQTKRKLEKSALELKVSLSIAWKIEMEL